jgi:4-hydroxy-3-methylbut-2-enyl diphosphate reductase
VGEAPQSIIVVESPEEVEQLTLPAGSKLAFVTQTTLSISDAMRTISALKAKYPGIKAPPKEDICYATTNRQNAVSDLSPEVDLVLVVGSKNSSNSQRLVETAKLAGRAAYLIDDQSELDPAWVHGRRAVLVTAGASAPEHLVAGLVERLQREFDGETETRTLIEEDVSFELPKSLKRLAVVSA